MELEIEQWQDMGADLLQTLQSAENRCLVMLDELPVFLLNLLRTPGRERARHFLNWFRQVRNDRQARLRVRWLICGSIGLDTVAQRERLGDTINDFAIERLGPFPRPTANSFLADLAANYSIKLHADVHEHILDKIDWLIPYHLQLLFAMVRDLGVAAPDVAAVDQAYRLSRFDEADAAYRRALELAPNDPKILNGRAWQIYISNGDLEAAEQIAQKAVDHSPDNPYYTHTLACIQAARGQWPDELARQFLTDERSRHEFWDDILLFFSEAARHGHAARARSLLLSLPDPEAWTPLITALDAIEHESTELLLALSPEMRAATELVLSKISPELMRSAPDHSLKPATGRRAPPPRARP